MQLLFSPIRIGKMELKNRMVMAAMGTGQANPGGTVSERTLKYYIRRAMGGVGMVIVETTTVDPSGLISKTRLRIDDDRFIESLSVLASQIKAHGARAAIQLAHRGRQATREEVGAQPIGPSPIPAPGVTDVPRELSVEEINRLIDAFAEGARRAKEAGFDAVEIHGAHGYLVGQFLSRSSNIRKDEFGGDINGRARFAVEMVRRMKKRVGKEFPLLFRFSADEHVEDGTNLEEAKIVARLVEDAGADAIHVSAGNYATFEWVVQPMALPRGCLVSLAEGIKKVVAVPVITVGRINDPSLAESILQEGKADIIALGRPLIADPDFPQKALEKREKEIRKCIACNVCIDSRIRLKADLRCTINPEFGKEEEYQYKPARARKKVLVIGGGPGGMEAARVARIRGHQVTLCEESGQLGGQLILAAKAPSKKEIRNITDYYEHMLKKLGVDVQLQTKATLEMVEELKPGVIIVATGAYALRPNIPGSDRSNAVTAHDVFGERVKLKGKNVVIIGGGAVGCETAEYLSEKGFVPTVVEMLGDVAMDVEKITRKTVLDILSERNIKVLTHAGVTRIEKGKVVFIDGAGKEKSITADTVILAMGARPDDELMKRLKERGLPVFAVGDCVEPRKAIDAIQEGFSIGCGI